MHRISQKMMPVNKKNTYFFIENVLIRKGTGPPVYQNRRQNKKTDRIPEGEIERAERIMQDFLQRNKGDWGNYERYSKV